MAGKTHEQLVAAVLTLLCHVPAGRIVTHGQIGAHLGVFPGHIASVLVGLDAAGRADVPWWRAVADGGAIGRHSARDEQIRLLRAEGVLVAPVGIVQELDRRRIASVAAPGAAIAPPAAGDMPQQPSRSRGIKGRPTSSSN